MKHFAIAFTAILSLTVTLAARSEANDHTAQPPNVFSYSSTISWKGDRHRDALFSGDSNAPAARSQSPFPASVFSLN